VYSLPMTVIEYAQIVGSIAGALLAVLALIGRVVMKPIRKAVQSSFERMLDERLAPLEDTLRELRPNGGSSLADKVIRLEERQSGISQRLDDVYELVKTLAR
jgi:Flp pilus assembly pilin Flp